MAVETYKVNSHSFLMIFIVKNTGILTMLLGGIDPEEVRQLDTVDLENTWGHH